MEKLIHGKNCIGICKETAESEGEEGKRNGEARAEEEDERSVERTISRICTRHLMDRFMGGSYIIFCANGFDQYTWTHPVRSIRAYD